MSGVEVDTIISPIMGLLPLVLGCFAFLPNIFLVKTE